MYKRQALISFIWFGAAILVLGAMIAMWPEVVFEELGAFGYIRAAASVATAVVFGFIFAGASSAAKPSKRFVSPLMALGTTTIWWPARAHLATRRATLRMRSGEPMEVPPYL